VQKECSFSPSLMDTLLKIVVPDIGPNIDMLATQTGFEPVRLFRCCVSEELSELKRRVSSFR
jgi:hypothetical protein